MKMKKLTSVLLTLVMLLSLGSFGALAAGDVADDNRARQIEEICYEKEIAYAVLTDDNGEQTPVDVTYTVVEIPAKRDAGGAVTYAVTAEAKTKSGSADANNGSVSLSIYMTMYWTDVPGTANVLNKLTGGYSLASGTVTNSRIFWGPSSHLMIGNTTTGTATSFNEAINWTTTSAVGAVSSRYQVWYTGGSLTLDVEPTIFD